MDAKVVVICLPRRVENQTPAQQTRTFLNMEVDQKTSGVFRAASMEFAANPSSATAITHIEFQQWNPQLL